MTADSDPVVVDYYEEFGLSREDDAGAILAQLGRLQVQNRERAGLSGDEGTEAQDRLAMIDDAMEIFASPRAREEYDRSLEVGDAEENDWVDKAVEYFRQDDLGAALTAARKGVDEDPDSPRAHAILASTALSSKNYDEAIEHAIQALVLDEDGQASAWMHLVRGKALLGKGDCDAAMESCDRALAAASDEEKPEAYILKSMIHRKRKQLGDAMTACLDGLAFDPDMDGEMRVRVDREAFSVIMDARQSGVGVPGRPALLDDVDDSIGAHPADPAVKQRVSGIVADLVQLNGLEEVRMRYVELPRENIPPRDKELERKERAGLGCLVFFVFVFFILVVVALSAGDWNYATAAAPSSAIIWVLVALILWLRSRRKLRKHEVMRSRAYQAYSEKKEEAMEERRRAVQEFEDVQRQIGEIRQRVNENASRLYHGDVTVFVGSRGVEV